MALADEIRAVLSDPSNLPPELLNHIVQHSAQNPVPVQSFNAPTVIASGVGSTANSPTRYVGGTASGAPASGTYVAGDFVVSHDGHVYICTATGTPGTWSTWPAQGQIAYNAITSPVTLSSVTAATPDTVVAGTAISYTGAMICIELYACDISCLATTGGVAFFQLWDGASCVGMVGKFAPSGTSFTEEAPFYAQVILTPSVGSHTYSLKGYKSTSTGLSCTIQAGSGGSTTAASPAFVRVRYA